MSAIFDSEGHSIPSPSLYLNKSFNDLNISQDNLSNKSQNYRSEQTQRDGKPNFVDGINNMNEFEYDNF